MTRSTLKREIKDGMKAPNELLMRTYMIIPVFVKYMYEDLLSRPALGYPSLTRSELFIRVLRKKIV